MVTITLYARQRKRHRCIEQTFGLWEKVRVRWSERTALKRVYYQVWNRSPAQVGCMRQVLRAGALGRPRGMGWGGRREGGLGWGTHVNPWLIHVNVWQKPLQYCKVISLQLIKINEKKRKKEKFICYSSNLQWDGITNFPSGRWFSLGKVHHFHDSEELIMGFLSLLEQEASSLSMLRQVPSADQKADPDQTVEFAFILDFPDPTTERNKQFHVYDNML